MIIIIFGTFLIISLFFFKRVFVKILRVEYEKSLLKGNRKKAVQLGKTYYLSLDEATRKAKGIVDIDSKISDDFRAFNNRHFSLF